MTGSIDWPRQNVLITGGTGSFGRAFIRHALSDLHPKRLIAFSRDELKQSQLQAEFPSAEHPELRFFIGDVRDRERLYRALDGIDIVVHAAALKQVPTAEYNPLEAIKTNILGAANLVDAAIDRGVRRVIGLSTDKAANPINLYGATKLCSDKLLIAANAYAGAHETLFSVVRYGNVIGSRGSVVLDFINQRSTGRVTITDPRMTRFFLSVERGVEFVSESLELMLGGEVLVPKIPSVRITDLARVVAPDCRQDMVGIRPGEKLHEVMVPEDESRLTLEFDDRYVIQPSHPFSADRNYGRLGGMPCPEGFRYSSDTNPWQLDSDEIAQLVRSAITTHAPTSARRQPAKVD